MKRLQEAIDVARNAGASGILAASLFMLAQTYARTGDHLAAEEAGREAHGIYLAMGRPEAKKVAGWLVARASQ